MKAILMIVAVMSFSMVVNAGETTKKVNRKPASVSGSVSYSGPIGINGIVPKGAGAGPLSISGPAADSIYDQMTALTPSTDPGGEKVGRGIVCRKDTTGHAICSLDFDDITNGVISPTGPWVWAAAPNQ